MVVIHKLMVKRRTDGTNKAGTLPQPFDSSRQKPPVLAHGPERATDKVDLAERVEGLSRRR